MRSPCSLSALFGSKRILWQNLSGSYVIGLDRLCPIHTVACLDDGPELEQVQRRSGTQFLSRERATRRRVRTPDPSTEEIIPSLQPEMERVLAGFPKSSWLLVCPRACRTLEVFAHERGYRHASPSADLCHWLNHKANFFTGLDHLRLRRLPGRWLRVGQNRFAEIHSEFGGRFVLQAPRGFTGSGTAIVDSERDYAEAGQRLSDTEVWAAPYLGPLSLNINAFAMASRAAVSYPSVQLDGLEMLGARPGMYCGNDFTSTALLPKQIVENVQEQTERIGGWLASLGYRGIYGVDFLIEPGAQHLYPVDLNPRWQGSTVLETQAMLRAGRLPLAAAEIAYQTGMMGESEVAPYLDAFRKPLQGSQLLPYAREIKAVEMRRKVLPGIYAGEQELHFLRGGLELGDCAEPEELLIGGGIARAGTRIEPGSRPARISSLRGVVDPLSCQPLPWSRQAAGQFYRLFGLTSPRGSAPARAALATGP